MTCCARTIASSPVCSARRTLRPCRSRRRGDRSGDDGHVEQLGPRTLQSLALVAEVIHGTPTRFEDPARFSFAHGGKDGHPFPVPLETYDRTIAVLRRGLDLAKIDRTEKLDGFKRLDRLVRATEQRLAPQADFDAVIAHEHAISPSLGGRTVFDGTPRRPRQLDLW